MTLSLNTIRPAKGAIKKKKRVGRGNSSGHGTYSTRGLKGQKSRSGASGLKLVGIKKTLRAIPKSRGFKSPHPKNQVVKIGDLNGVFSDGAKINRQSLVKAGLIDTIKAPVKILGTGNLKLTGLEFSDIKFSASGREQVERMKGKINS